MAIEVNPNTTPLFTQLGPYCQGSTPAVFPTTSNNGIAGSWSPSTISTASAGTTVYTFTPTSTAPSVCATGTTMSITVTTLPTAVISGTTTLCQNSTPPIITFTGSNSTAPYTFTYTINGGAAQTITTVGTSSSVTLSVPTATPGIYNYSLLSVSVGSCSNNIANQVATISVFENPTITLSNQTICGGNNITLQPIVTPTGGQYNWQGPSINGLTSPTVTVSPSNNTNYSLTYTSNGCSTNQSVAVNVIQNPTASVNSETICLGQSATLVASPSGATYSWSNGTSVIGTGQTLTVSPTVTSTYTVSVSVGGCAATTATSTVTVNPIPTVTAAPGVTICNGQTTTIGTTVSAPGGTYSWTPSGTSSSLTVTPSLSNPTTQQSFTYSVVYALNGCPSLPSSSTITVNPKPTLSVNNLVICSGNNDNIIAVPNLPNGIFNWSTGLSGLTQNILNVSQVANPINQVTVYSYDAWYILNGCSSDTVTSAVTVNPNPTLTSANTATICSEETLGIPLTTSSPGSTFTWVAADNPNITGESTVAVSSATINNTLINNTPNSQTVVYTVTPIFGLCQGTPQTVNVVVNPTPVIATINDIICSNGSFDIIPNPAAAGNIIPVGTTYTWTVANNTNVSNENNNAIAGPNIFGGPLGSSSTSNTTVIYTVTPQSGNCIGDPFTTNITITPTPVISNKVDSICSGDFPVITAAAVDIIPSTVLYTWTVVSAGAGINGETDQITPVANFNSQVLINTTFSAQEVVYQVVPQSGPCPGQPFTFTVTVNPGPSLSNASYDICSNDSWTVVPGLPNDIVPVGTTFIWSVTPNANVNGESSNGVPSSNFFTGVLQNNTNVNQTVVYSVTPIGPATAQPQCNGLPFQISVTVFPTPVYSNVTLPAICSGTSFTFDPNTNPPAGAVLTGTTYLTWSVVPNPDVTGYSNFLGTTQTAISQTLTNSTNVVQNVVYNVTASISNTFAQCNSATFQVIVPVQPTPLIQNVTVPIVCSGDAFTVNPINNPPTQIVPVVTAYSWPNPVSTPLLQVGGGSAQTNQAFISQVLTNTGLTDATLTYTVTPSYVASPTLTCPGNNFTINVIVRPIPTVTAVALEDTICPNTSTTITAVGVPATNSAGVPGSYNWTPIAQISGSSTSSVITAQPTTTTTYIVEYTLSTCQSQVFPVTITVQNPPNISTMTATENTICVGGCTDITANFIGGTAVDYVEWSTGQITTTAPHTILVCPSSTTTYTAIAYLQNCNGLPSTITINVNPDPFFTQQPLNDTTLCVGGTIPLSVVVSGGAGTPSYQWYQNTVNSNIGGTLIPGATNATLIPSTFNTPGTFYYYCVVSYAPNGCGFITSNPSQINVVNDPVVSINANDETLCIGGTPQCLTAVVSGGVGTTTFTWNQGGTGNIFCPPGLAVGTELYTVSVTQTGIGCAANSQDVITVTIVPDPVITISGIEEACFGAQVQLTSQVTGGIGSINGYQWAQSVPLGFPYTDINGAIGQSFLTYPLNESIDFTLEITQTGSGCNDTDTFNIAVFDDPNVTIIGSELTCLGEEILLEAQITGGTASSTNTLTWFALNPNGAVNPYLLQGPNGDITYDYISSSDTTIYVDVVNSGFGCDVTSDTISLLGLAPAIAQFDATPTSQSFFNPTFSFINSSENATEYLWDLNECNPPLPDLEMFSTPTPYYNPTSESIYDYTYGCPPGVITVQLIATNNGICPDTAYLNINIEPDVICYVPNAFTPDGNGDNELFYPVFSHMIDPLSYTFRIYDRWGEIIFETNEIPEIPTTPSNTLGAWNGLYNGRMAQDGVYIWEVYYRAEGTSNNQHLVGHVTVLKEVTDYINGKP
jgi:hypothetical protein